MLMLLLYFNYALLAEHLINKIRFLHSKCFNFILNLFMTFTLNNSNLKVLTKNLSIFLFFVKFD